MSNRINQMPEIYHEGDGDAKFQRLDEEKETLEQQLNAGRLGEYESLTRRLLHNALTQNFHEFGQLGSRVQHARNFAEEVLSDVNEKDDY